MENTFAPKVVNVPAVENDASTPVLQAALRPPPVLSPGVVASLALGLLLLLGIWSGPLDGSTSELWSMSLLVAILALSPLLFSIRGAQNSTSRKLRLFEDRVDLPLNATSAHILHVPLKELTGLVLFRRGPRTFLLIGTGPMDFVYPVTAFVRSEDARRFHDELKARLRNVLPAAGARRPQALDVEERRALSALERVPWFTIFLAATLLGVAGYQVLIGASRDPYGAFVFGGLAKSLILEGEVHRLFSYPLVHPVQSAVAGDMMDFAQFALILSVLALFLVGPTLERLVGPWTTALAFLGGSVVGGALVAFTREHALVAGAAGGWFGLVGAGAFLWFEARDRLPLGFRATHRLLFWTGLLAVVFTMTPEVTMDLVLGGLLGGVLAVALIAQRPLPMVAPIGVKVGAGALIAVHALGLAVSVASYDDARLPMVVDASDDPWRLNHFAWNVALEDEPDPERLDLAERSARRAIGLMADVNLPGGAASIEDTLATVRFRQGHVADAIEIERGVLDQIPNAHSASQLGRFILLGGDVRPAGTSTVAASFTAHRADDGRIQVRSVVETPASGRLTAFGILRSGGQEVAVFQVELDPSGEPQDVLLDTPDPIEGGGELEPVGVWIREGGAKSRVWPFAEVVRDYPSERLTP